MTDLDRLPFAYPSEATPTGATGQRRQRRDPVTHEIREAVLLRDGRCVAAILDPDHWPCRDRWGSDHGPGMLDLMTLDHVQSGYGRMGRRAQSDPAHLVTLCWGAHLLTSWATSHRPELRAYLARMEAAA